MSGLAHRWRRFHERPWAVRAGIKLALFAAVVALVLYPRFWLLPTWIERLRNMNTVIDPADPGLAPLEAIVRGRVRADAPPQQVLGVVQQVVYEKIPYAWDWDTWGVMDYLPSVRETLALGREDCDGRAVVAASLLRRLGHEAWLVSDFTHTWVETTKGETMSPGRAAKALVARPGAATSVAWDVQIVQSYARAVSYGLGVFPLPRLMLITAALCVVALQPRSSLGRRIAGCGLLLAALAALRYAGLKFEAPGMSNVVWTVTGAACLIGGLALLLIRGAAPPARSAGALPGSPAADGAPPCSSPDSSAPH